MHTTDTAWELWRSSYSIISSRFIVFAERFKIYHYFRESSDYKDWERILLMFNDAQRLSTTELDYRFRLWALIKLDSSELVDDSFSESLSQFSKEMETQLVMILEYHLKRLEPEFAFRVWSDLFDL